MSKRAKQVRAMSMSVCVGKNCSVLLLWRANSTLWCLFLQGSSMAEVHSHYPYGGSFIHNTNTKLFTASAPHCSALPLKVSGGGTGLSGFEWQVPAAKSSHIGCEFQKLVDNTVQGKESWMEYLQSHIQACEISEYYGTSYWSSFA